MGQINQPKCVERTVISHDRSDQMFIFLVKTNIRCWVSDGEFFAVFEPESWRNADHSRVFRVDVPHHRSEFPGFKILVEQLLLAKCEAPPLAEIEEFVQLDCF